MGDSCVSLTVTFLSGGLSYVLVTVLSVVGLSVATLCLMRVVSAVTNGVGDDNGLGVVRGRGGSTRRGVVTAGGGRGVVVASVVVVRMLVVVGRSSAESLDRNVFMKMSKLVHFFKFGLGIRIHDLWYMIRHCSNEISPLK